MSGAFDSQNVFLRPTMFHIKKRKGMNNKERYIIRVWLFAYMLKARVQIANTYDF